MTNKEDKARKEKKIKAIAERIAEIGPSLDLLLSILDETKLDLMVLALGIGKVITRDEEENEHHD